MIAFALALIWGILTGHVHTYDYSNGQAGIVVQVSSTQCIGYEYQGEVGLFGNILGAPGGDCS